MNINRTIVLFFSIILLSCSAKTVSDHLKMAQKSSKKGNHTLTEYHYKQVLKLDSLNFEAYNGIAMTSLKKKSDTNNINFARENFLKALSIDSTKAWTWYGLAYTYKVQSITKGKNNKQVVNHYNLNRAKRYLDRAIKLNNKVGEFYSEKAYCVLHSSDTTGYTYYLRQACNRGHYSSCIKLEYK